MKLSMRFFPKEYNSSSSQLLSFPYKQPQNGCQVFGCPAKAGIQFLNSFRVANKAAFTVIFHSLSDNFISWIPAFAGMTVALCCLL